MAKKKHSTALFEVITKSRQPTPLQSHKPSAVLATPRWWFKRRPAVEASPQPPAGPVAVQAPPTASYAAAAPNTTIQRIVEDHPSALPGDANVDHQIMLARSEDLAAGVITDVDSQSISEVTHEPQPVSIDADASAYEDVLIAPRAQSVAVAVDPERRQISLRMSYTAAIVGAFAVLVVVGLAIIVGQHMSHSSVPLLAQTSTKKLRQGEPHREVLEPPRRGGNNLGQPSNPNPAPPINRGPVAPSDNRGVDSQGSDGGQAPAPAPGDEKRTFGLNYVVIQSYPKEEEKMATEAANFLNKEGISCTIETKVRGYLPITVVGLKGFERATSPEMKAYQLRILQASAKYAGTTRSFKAFAPATKKWMQVD